MSFTGYLRDITSKHRINQDEWKTHLKMFYYLAGKKKRKEKGKKKRKILSPIQILCSFV